MRARCNGKKSESTVFFRNFLWVSKGILASTVASNDDVNKTALMLE